MSTTPPPDADAWTGWHRQHRHARCRAAVQGSSFDECLDSLMDAVEGGDLIVLPRGRHPDAPPPAASRASR